MPSPLMDADDAVSVSPDGETDFNATLIPVLARHERQVPPNKVGELRAHNLYTYQRAYGPVEHERLVWAMMPK